MTVIAIKDGVLACDSGIFAGGVYVGSVTKAARMSNGNVIGAAGEYGAISPFLAQCEGGHDADLPDDLPKDSWALMLSASGGIYCLDGPHKGWFVIDAPFAALGSGANIAIGAMAAGASAERAVEIACEWAEGCRGPVRIFKAGERP